MSEPVEKQRHHCYIPIHDEVKTALVDWKDAHHIDIAFIPLLRFLVTYSHANHIRDDLSEVAKDSIYWLDTSNLMASEGEENGRIRQRFQTTSSLIIEMSEEERYISLLCGLHALDITIDELAL